MSCILLRNKTTMSQHDFVSMGLGEVSFSCSYLLVYINSVDQILSLDVCEPFVNQNPYIEIESDLN